MQISSESTVITFDKAYKLWSSSLHELLRFHVTSLHLYYVYMFFLALYSVTVMLQPLMWQDCINKVARSVCRSWWIAVCSSHYTARCASTVSVLSVFMHVNNNAVLWKTEYSKTCQFITANSNNPPQNMNSPLQPINIFDIWRGWCIYKVNFGF